MAKGKKKLSPDKQRRFVINDNLYKGWLLVMTGGTKQEAVKRFLKAVDHKDDSEPNNKPAEGCVISVVDSNCVGIYFSDHRPRPGVVAHEAIHAAIHVLEFAGIRMGSDSIEALTYYVEWLVGEIERRVAR